MGPVAWESRVRAALEERDRLRARPMFADTGSRQVDLLAVKLQVRNFAPGDVIVKQGDPGDAFYIVRQGSLEVLPSKPHGLHRRAQ